MKFLADIEASIGEITETSQGGLGFNYWSEFINMMITLGFILVLIIVSVYALKRIMRSRIQHLNRSTAIKIHERRALNSKSALYLVDVFGKGIVIAESPSGIQTVTELDKDTNIEELLKEAQAQQPTPSISFSQKLRKVVKRGDA